MRYIKGPVFMVLVLVVALSVMAFFGFSATSVADAASPTVTLPPDVNEPLSHGHADYDMADIGYMESEFFVEGTADYYTPIEPLTSDGKWTVAPADQQALYKTRIIVDRPIDPEDFNGTVLVEWYNVSGCGDGSPFWMQGHVELARRGWVWVGVTAQYAGLQQLKCSPCCPMPAPYCPDCPNPYACPAPGDPVRYASLTHPGDSYSYDIFSQVGQAILDNAELVLGGLEPERLIAGGESQSAGRLTTYINAAHPLAEVYDGFCIYSRGATGSALSEDTMLESTRCGGPVYYDESYPYWPDVPPDVSTPMPTLIRDDLVEPVLMFQTDTDLFLLYSFYCRQPDTEKFRLWEVAGTAHFDIYGLRTNGTDIGERESVEEWFNYLLEPISDPNPMFPCAFPVNNGPSTFVLRAGLAHLNQWIIDGTPPPVADRLQVEDPTTYPYFYVDAHGNALGGIRTPAVDAPVARLSGYGQTGAPFCASFGTTIPFTDETIFPEGYLEALYGNHGGFASAWKDATEDALKAGFLVKEDAQYLRAVGDKSSILK